MDLSDRLLFGMAGLHLILSPSKRQRLLGAAIEQGFRAFDVAPSYGNGLGELELGIALAGRRDRFRITTKFGIPVSLYGARFRRLFLGVRLADKFLNPFHGRAYARRDFSAETMQRSLEGSLRRLKTDHVDALMIHAPLEALALDRFDEIAEAAQRLKQTGLLGDFGLAGDVEPMRAHLDHPLVDVIEAPLWDIERLESRCSARKVAFAVYRHYSATDRALSFADFLERAAGQLDSAEFILTASGETGLDRFAGVMR